MITKGTRVDIRFHRTDPGKGLDYDNMRDAILAEDCNGEGWDVIDVLWHDQRHSVYSFSVTRASHSYAPTPSGARVAV